MFSRGASFLQYRFAFLLLALISYFLINSLIDNDRKFAYFFDLFFSFMVLICTYVVSHKKYLLIMLLFLSLVIIGSYWWIRASLPLSQPIVIIHCVTLILFLFIILIMVGSTVSKQKRITIDTLAGAICGYLLIGMTWGAVYLLIATLDHQSFTHSLSTEIFRIRAQHYGYFSFVTLTTLGYGDIVALSSIAKTCSWLEAVTGQIYLAVWISQLVGLHIVQLQEKKQEKDLK